MFIYEIGLRRKPHPVKRCPSIVLNDPWLDSDFARQIIHFVAVYDCASYRFRVFGESNRDEFNELANSDRVAIYFDGRNYNSRAIESTLGWIHPKNGYDLQHEIWEGLGLDPGKYDPKTHCSYGLNEVARANDVRLEKGELNPIGYRQSITDDEEVLQENFKHGLATVELIKKLLLKAQNNSPDSGTTGLLTNPQKTDEQFAFVLPKKTG